MAWKLETRCPQDNLQWFDVGGGVLLTDCIATRYNSYNAFGNIRSWIKGSSLRNVFESGVLGLMGRGGSIC